LQTDKINKQAELDKQTAQTSITSKEELAAKLLEIENAAQKERENLTKQYVEKSIDSEKEIFNRANELRKKDLEEKEATNIWGITNTEEARNLRLAALEIEEKAIEDKYANKILNEEEYQKKMHEIRLAYKDLEIEAEKEKAEVIKQIKDELIKLAVKGVDSLYESKVSSLNQELADLQHYYTTSEEEAANNSEKQYMKKEEYAAKELEIKRKIAKAEKEQAIFDVGVSVIQAVAGTLAQRPIGIWNIALAAIMAASGAVQIAAIKAKPLPKYWKGRRGGQGEFAMVGEYGPELMWIPSSSSIMPAHDTQKALAGNVNVFDKWDMPQFNFMPPMPHVDQSLVNQFRNEGGLKIDYDLLGQSVAKYQKQPEIDRRPVNISIDRSGVNVTKGNNTTRSLNYKYCGDV
jgi:hypothetical protein